MHNEDDLGEIFGLVAALVLVVVLIIMVAMPALITLGILGLLTYSTFFAAFGYSFLLCIIGVLLGILYLVLDEMDIGFKNSWAFFSIEITIPRPVNDLEAFTWCQEHCTGKWEKLSFTRYRFLRKKDAVRFKLAWG